MSIEQVKAFRKAVNESEELQERILAGDDWVEVAKEVGFEFTKKELRTFTEGLGDKEQLSEFELNYAAGGFSGPICGL